MTDIPIPPQAVEAAAREIAEQLGDDWDDNVHALCGDDFGLTPDGAKAALRTIATAALRAGLAAWPGVGTQWLGREPSSPLLILPLPQDKQS